MGAVIHSSIYEELDQNPQKVTDFLISHVNIVNNPFENLNIIIILKTIIILPDEDYVKISSNDTVTISDLNEYISKQMPDRDSVDFVAFFTPGLSSEGFTINGAMGSRNRSGMILYADPFSVTETSFTLTHELLHLLGVGHDKDENFLMAKKTTVKVSTMLSKASILELNEKMPEIVDRLIQTNQHWTVIDTDSKNANPAGGLEADSNDSSPVHFSISFGILLIIVCVLVVMV